MAGHVSSIIFQAGLEVPTGYFAVWPARLWQNKPRKFCKRSQTWRHPVVSKHAVLNVRSCMSSNCRSLFTSVEPITTSGVHIIVVMAMQSFAHLWSRIQKLTCTCAPVGRPLKGFSPCLQTLWHSKTHVLATQFTTVHLERASLFLRWSCSMPELSWKSAHMSCIFVDASTSMYLNFKAKPGGLAISMHKEFFTLTKQLQDKCLSQSLRMR